MATRYYCDRCKEEIPINNVYSASAMVPPRLMPVRDLCKKCADAWIELALSAIDGYMVSLRRPGADE